MDEPTAQVYTLRWTQPLTNAYCNAQVVDGHRTVTASDHDQAEVGLAQCEEGPVFNTGHKIME